ncbi:DEAD/DEAH box helicase [Bacillus sp. FJAT-21945]|nr:DEAD/DEAH box helicase [Bacillus sp. FJAT-21945]
MNIEKANELLQKIERDSFIQNLIAQGDSRYILFNVQESVDNFPNFTLNLDSKLTHIAFSYLSIGCTFAEKSYMRESILPLEKGAGILEYVYKPIENRKEFSSYYILASSLAYYAANQYSKSFILTQNVDLDTDISKLLGLFLRRNFKKLGQLISEISLSNKYNINTVSSVENYDDANTLIYTLILSKSLSALLEFIFSGDSAWLEKSKEYSTDLLELLSIDEEPSLWWCIRLFQIIIEGFYQNSLWKIIPPKINDNNHELVTKYINTMVFQQKPVTELFQSQKEVLTQALNPQGAVISLPTSSGKTRIAEISILQELINEPEGIILYLTPFRSLAFEVEESLSKIFRPLGVEVSHLYGGTQYSKIDELILNESNVIIATPEKAKAIFRSNSHIKKKIKLVIIDEGHLIGPEERYITSELLIEELRFHITKNKGKMILLSAVLPNTDEIAHWITGNSGMKAHSDWRPSTQRFGLVEYTGNNVNITWKGELESFNRNFINPFTVKRPRSEYTFPKEKKQAIAAVALKMASFGSVLIFVGRQNMVVSQGKEIITAMGLGTTEHSWTNQVEWYAFKLACEEVYGSNSEIYKCASHGILCHHAGLPSEVRLIMEKLMRSSNPKIIVSTSTLGQGVNIGVSSVIIANVWLNQNDKIKHSDFWNIAGRAGRSFVDTEGKILYVVDASSGARKARRERELAIQYFHIEKQNDVISGLLYALQYFFQVAKAVNIDFDTLLELIANNDFSRFKHEHIDTFDSLLDLLDDTLLSLNLEFESYNLEDKSSWIEDFFKNSLAFIQSQHLKMKEEDIIALLKARNKAILRLAGESSNWKGLVSSSVPLRTGLFIKKELSTILDILLKFQETEKSTIDLINFINEIEEFISKFPSDQFKGNLDIQDLNSFRECWISGKSINTFDEKDIKNYNQYYGFTLPWALNAIARMLSTIKLEEECKIFEDLAVLVQMGLPNMFAVNIYLSGIQSRVSATELSNKLEQNFQGTSIRKLRSKIIKIADTIPNISENTRRWVQLLKDKESKLVSFTDKLPDFIFKSNVAIKNKRLFVKKFNEEFYLCSPDFEDQIKVKITKKFPFNKYTDNFGIYFENIKQDTWTMKIRNPYIKHDLFDLLGF